MKAIELYKNNDHIILITSIEFSKLNNIVKFSKREASNWSIEENFDIESDKFYQRSTNEKRVKDIKKYIEDNLINNLDNSNVLFPSSLILSTDFEFENLKFDNGIVDFEFPIEKESCLIVDGQHRMKAMESLYNDYMNANKSVEKINNYKFNCTLLINYDLWEQARIFADVNFNQKPVDRSLYYDIFGEIPRENKDYKLSNLYVAHELGKYLNKSEKSPLKGFVKDFDRKTGFVSQSFLMQAILPNFSPKGTWNYITDDFKKDGDAYKKLPKVFVAYFDVIKDIFKAYWPVTVDKSSATILTKTNALGALIKLLGWIDKNLKLGLYKKSEKVELLDLSLNDLEKLFRKMFLAFENNNELIEKYFGAKSKYSGSGSAGLQNQLFKELAEEIGIPTSKKNVN
ncbi:hypothetical protein GCM10010992_04880 [Cloacibacterium rupense]|uniref:DGQHR domain-containing protein n=1 Tax=Cloacibacterium rupense TaxID=517423 RepID=A0ABQ2NH06_9FLAO|nr:DGQHR domain-containing protein [Cloacibacterium rupense]GGP02050.1 hypothetical protein GCM10010992_04880 [Cloacibacterium rupense]